MFYNPKKREFFGAPKKAKRPITEMARKGYLIPVMMESAKAHFRHFLEGDWDREILEGLQALHECLYGLKDIEDPFDVFHAFLGHYQPASGDLLSQADWRFKGSFRTRNRREGQLARGEISGQRGYKERDHLPEEEWEGDLEFCSSFEELGKDVVMMPLFTNDDAINAYAARRGLVIDVEGVLDESFLDEELGVFCENRHTQLTIEEVVLNQYPCVRLSTGEAKGKGSYAIYAMLVGGDYVRVFQYRVNSLAPRGPDLKRKKPGAGRGVETSTSLH